LLNDSYKKLMKKVAQTISVGDTGHSHQSRNSDQYYCLGWLVSYIGQWLNIFLLFQKAWWSLRRLG
jgi:hypothetical protein